MHPDRISYLCPKSRQTLRCVPHETRGDRVISGKLVCDAAEYAIEDGIPLFVAPEQLLPVQRATLDYYDEAAANYDEVAGLSFSIQYVDEEQARGRFADRLELTPSMQVLELACGTGRDAVHIAARMGENGLFVMQDLSRAMLRQCRDKLARATVPTEFVSGNACALPYPDQRFDAVYSFGGLCVFGDMSQALREMVRVAKPGARIVIGDESLAPWLYDTEYGRILLNNNPLFSAELPLKYLPPEARDVRVQWVVGGVYFLIDFTVGTGEPAADFDRIIPGQRGGSLRTRYYGKLEGVTPEAYRLMEEARKKSGISRHDWLEMAIWQAAQQP